MPTDKLLNRVVTDKPCSEKWEEMIGNDQARFCSHCDLTVQDLSQLTRAQAVQRVRRSKDRMCLRIHRNPAGEIITRDAILKLHSVSRRASRFAAGAFSAVVGLSGAAYAQSAATTDPANQDRSVAAAPLNLETAGTFSWLAGCAVDPNGAVIAGVTVTVTNEQTKETNAATTNDDGEFRLWLSGNYTYEVVFTGAPGFATSTFQHVAIRLGAENRVDTELKLSNETVTLGVVAVSYERPLVIAASENDLATVKQLLRSGVDVNLAEEEGTTALDVAVGHGNLKVVRRLLRAGARVDLGNSSGGSALFWLYDENGPEMLTLLVKAGANLYVRDSDGNTPLLRIVEYSNGELIQALIDAGADINAQNNDGNSALMIAVSRENTDAVRVLLKAGAIYGLCNSDSKDALQLAVEEENEEICDLLHAAGAVDTSNASTEEK